jgi:hypothetical protein
LRIVLRIPVSPNHAGEGGRKKEKTLETDLSKKKQKRNMGK